MQELLLSIIKLFSNSSIIFISGASATGKTSLVQFVLGSYFSQESNGDDCCVWIQASELFPKKRFLQIFPPEHLGKFFVTPKEGIYGSYEVQREGLISFTSELSLLPPYTKFLVIDNISNHLRYEISKFSDVRDISSRMNGFFNDQIFPLVMFCNRMGITLIFIHEVTYDPKLGKNKPFYNSLYNRVKGALRVVLSRDFFTREYTINISQNGRNITYCYDIIQKGFLFKG